MAEGVFPWPSRRQWAWACLTIGLACVVELREQLAAFTSVPDLGDPLFSMWRLAWVAHQLPLDPAHFFEGNIFHPAAHTVAYSDALVLPGLVASPAIWLGIPVAVVYTSLMVLSFGAAGLAMFALIRAVTNHTGGALIGSLIFAFDPYRFAQYSHLEMQVTFWMPLALLCLLRALSSGRRRDGLFVGVLLALQALSGLYVAAYFAVSLAVFVLCWMCVVERPSRRVLDALGFAAAVAIVAAGLVAIPYWVGRSTIGERQTEEIQKFSAVARDYLTPSHRSATYGDPLAERDGEHDLFPGTVPLVLGAAALVPPVGPIVVPTLAALVLSVDGSRGFNGMVYRGLDRLPGFRGFRVPARFRAIAGFYLALLAGTSAARFAARLRRPWVARIALGAIGLALLIEVFPRLDLKPIWTHVPGVYARIPGGAVLADMPFATARDPYWHDPIYVYFSTFHWHPITNGYSGFTPPWYAPLGVIAREFPSDQTLDAFRERGTEYFVLHEGFYHEDFARIVADADAQPRLQFVTKASWEEGECRVYRLVR